MRFYGFDAQELTPQSGEDQGKLDLEVDPKLAWALRHRESFPIDLNRSPRELLLKVPGLGVRNADRLIGIRRWHAIRLDDLVKLRVSLNRCLPFIITADHHPARLGLDDERLRQRFLPKPQQLELDFSRTAGSAVSGQL